VWEREILGTGKRITHRSRFIRNRQSILAPSAAPRSIPAPDALKELKLSAAARAIGEMASHPGVELIGQAREEETNSVPIHGLAR
jgi:hypothetical protein